jgi:putative transposase
MVQDLPNRQSIRKKGWDYTAAGCYFVTCNTHQNRPLFGIVVNGQMVLNEAGRIAAEEWHKSAQIRDEIELDEFVIMPNHVHGVVRIVGATGRSPFTSGYPVTCRRNLAKQSFPAFFHPWSGRSSKRGWRIERL